MATPWGEPASEEPHWTDAVRHQWEAKQRAQRAQHASAWHHHRAEAAKKKAAAEEAARHNSARILEEEKAKDRAWREAVAHVGLWEVFVRCVVSTRIVVLHLRSHGVACETTAAVGHAPPVEITAHNTTPPNCVHLGGRRDVETSLPDQVVGACVRPATAADGCRHPLARAAGW